MAEEQKAELTPEQKLEQEKIAKVASEKVSGKEPIKPEPEKTVSEKQFKELQGEFTKRSQENADLKKEMAEIQERLKTAATTLSPQEEKKLEDNEDDLIEKTKAEIKYSEENGYSVAGLKLTLKQAIERKQERLEKQQNLKNMESFSNFMDKYDGEMKDPLCPYSMKELVAIQTEKIKNGENVSLETARDIWVARNQDKASKAFAEMKDKANGARSVDGKEAPPDGKGKKNIAKERWDAQFKQ
jgi:hypothetical protein